MVFVAYLASLCPIQIKWALCVCLLLLLFSLCVLLRCGRPVPFVFVLICDLRVCHVSIAVCLYCFLFLDVCACVVMLKCWVVLCGSALSLPLCLSSCPFCLYILLYDPPPLLTNIFYLLFSINYPVCARFRSIPPLTICCFF